MLVFRNKWHFFHVKEINKDSKKVYAEHTITMGKITQVHLEMQFIHWIDKDYLTDFNIYTMLRLKTCI